MRTYDVHYLDDLASLEYGMNPSKFFEMVRSKIIFFKFNRNLVDDNHGRLVAKNYEGKVYYIPKLTDEGLDYLRNKLKTIGIVSLHESVISFTGMVIRYNRANPYCVRDIGEKWNELNMIEDKGERFLKYRELSESELNLEDNFKVIDEYYERFR